MGYQGGTVVQQQILFKMLLAKHVN
ncbi:uncharacterized protein FTOL_13888 [Fusarium torulosum]|uniref:Uncharacterized protein n=1 Tax=Fusarium torulosum TaxID=33205 RepID=A0AAE8MMV7_9HYPO|nr:uncharacterized protein FTOL_13888 [Fusarium torulosum]